MSIYTQKTEKLKHTKNYTKNDSSQNDKKQQRTAKQTTKQQHKTAKQHKKQQKHKTNNKKQKTTKNDSSQNDKKRQKTAVHKTTSYAMSRRSSGRDHRGCYGGRWQNEPKMEPNCLPK